MRLSRLICLAALCMGGVQAADAQEPPTSEEAQAAYSRFATAVVGRLIAAGLPTTLSGGKFAEINEFAHRQALRGCDERREPDADPFAPADALPPPVVFNCTWESGERISLTRIANTGSWVVSDHATAAVGAGMLLVGPQLEAQRVAAIPTAPIKPPTPAEEPATTIAEAVANAPANAITYARANLRAMPSPFVPPARAEPERSSTPALTIGPMPTPFAVRAK